MFDPFSRPLLTYIKQSGESNGDAGDQYTGLDRFGRVVDQRWIITSSGSHTDRFQYGYDRDSNRLYKNNTVASAQSELYHANGSSASYDNLNRLTDFRRGTLSASGSTLDTVTTASHTQSWTLDALGNMPSVNTDGTSVSRSHDDGNEITAVGATSVTYTYRNLSNDGSQSYLYDVNNRLTTVKNAAGGSTIATYTYDALGRRISELPNGGSTTDVYYSAMWQALEDDQSGHTKSQYVWSPVYIDAMVLRDRDADNDGSHTLEERLYAEQDANYNLTSVINTSGSVQERDLFDAYGTRTVTDSSFSPRSGNTSSYDWKYGHQGLRTDEETGLISNRERTFSTALGRFLQIDPIITQSLVDGGLALKLKEFLASGHYSDGAIEYATDLTEFTSFIERLPIIQRHQFFQRAWVSLSLSDRQWTNGILLRFHALQRTDKMRRFNAVDAIEVRGNSSEAAQSYLYVQNNPTDFLDPSGTMRTTPYKSCEILYAACLKAFAGCATAPKICAEAEAACWLARNEGGDIDDGMDAFDSYINSHPPKSGGGGAGLNLIFISLLTMLFALLAHKRGTI